MESMQSPGCVEFWGLWTSFQTLNSEGARAEVAGVTVEVLAFEALEEDLGQSLSVCPG